MAFKAVKFDESFGESTEVTPLAPASEPARVRDRYDLATALRIVRAMETSAARAAVYDEIKAKNPVYRLVDSLYVKAGAALFQPLILLAYMLKCVVSLGPRAAADAEAVAIAHFPNEHKTIDRVAELAPDVRLHRLTIARAHMLAPAQIAAACQMLMATPRLWGFLRVLARRYSFMPSARIASALAFYMRCSHLLAANKQIAAAIVPSNYSPEAVGMAAAAHHRGRRVVYANHAPVPANGAVVPPVLADCALFYGGATTRTYQRRSRCLAEVAYIGQPGTPRAMQWREALDTVGIFLTAGTKAEVLKSLIASIRLDLPDARIIVRQHPVTLLKTDFSTIGVDDPNTELTIGNPLDDEIAACDLVICGNSGVSMNVLSGGRPVAYLSSLDNISFDANGFVASRLVLSVPWWTDDIYSRLKGFYLTPGWVGVMQSYDASYGVDLAGLHREAGQVLMRHLRPRPSGPEQRGGTDLMAPEPLRVA